MSNSKNLKSLGSKKTEYKTDKPRPELLETFENAHPDNLYLIPFVQERDEFTSLCPKTGQPDHAKLEIIYVPNKLCIESKSLKLYLFSFRQHGEFHEDVCNTIANTLFNLLEPRFLRVFGNFAARGGLAIKPMVVRWEDNFEDYETDQVNTLVTSWDLRA